jgi:hypothetical protein
MLLDTGSGVTHERRNIFCTLFTTERKKYSFHDHIQRILRKSRPALPSRQAFLLSAGMSIRHIIFFQNFCRNRIAQAISSNYGIFLFGYRTKLVSRRQVSISYSPTTVIPSSWLLEEALLINGTLPISYHLLHAMHIRLLCPLPNPLS